MKIVKFPDQALFTPTNTVTTFDATLHYLLDSMYEVMKVNNGLGLAANQVGILDSMFVMDGPEGRIDLVNPVIIQRSIGAANLKEGCLSAPGDFVVVPARRAWVHVKFYDKNGEPKARVFNGIHAVCVQHEIDHLLGKTFFADKSIPRNQRGPLMKKWGVK